MVIDLAGLTAEQVRDRFPAVYQHVRERVRPGRDAKIGRTKDADQYARDWWIFGKPRPQLRLALDGLPRFITTVETSKHRFFQFLDIAVLPDNRLVNIGLADTSFLAILSSRIHVAWALATGGTLEDRPIYQKSHCFDEFPFPDPTDANRARLASLGERLDKHRKDGLDQHSDLTMTRLYNLLEKLREIERAGAGSLNDKGRDIHDRGLVSVLRDLHDEIDDAASDAYGWPRDLGNPAILERLVALNKARAAEEARGEVHWLRPEFQDPDFRKERAAVGMQDELAIDQPVAVAATVRSLPGASPELIAAVRDVLAGLGGIAELRDIARAFKGRKGPAVREALNALVMLGLAESADDLYALTEHL